MRKTVFVLLVISCVVLGLATTAHAYWENYGKAWAPTGPSGAIGPNGDCNACHGISTANANGPHGGFSSSTDSCKACHKVHEANSTNKLLPATTELGVCMSCHDFSFTTSGGGGGVYGALRAQNLFTGSRHNIFGYNETDTGSVYDGEYFYGAFGKSYVSTQVIPGGGPATLPTNSANNHNLTCTNCHTPHGSTGMVGWVGERKRSSLTTVASNRILQDDLAGTAKGTYTTYGSRWCAACHKQRHDSSLSQNPVNNHPVNDNAAYGDVAQADPGANSWWTLMAATSDIPTQHMAGFSRLATAGSTWKPECQQCHEDYRNVEAAYSIQDTDTIPVGQNPAVQTFPHEGQAKNFKVESGDDLCLNCHPTTNLP